MTGSWCGRVGTMASRSWLCLTCSCRFGCSRWVYKIMDGGLSPSDLCFHDRLCARAFLCGEEGAPSEFLVDDSVVWVTQSARTISVLPARSRRHLRRSVSCQPGGVAKIKSGRKSYRFSVQYACVMPVRANQTPCGSAMEYQDSM